MLRGLFSKRKYGAPIQEKTVAPKTVDISIRNILTGKFTPMFGVDSQLACALRAAGIADAYVKPANVPVPTGPRFWVAPSTHSGVVGIHVELPGGETRVCFNCTTKHGVEASLGAGEMPQAVWDSYESQSKARAGNSPQYG
jgi:hypothetical protein